TVLNSVLTTSPARRRVATRSPIRRASGPPAATTPSTTERYGHVGGPGAPRRSRSDGVELLQGVAEGLDAGSLDVFSQVGNRRRPGDEEGGRRALQEPGESDLEGCRVETGGDAIEHVGLHGLEATEREEGRVRDPLARTSVDQRVVGPVGQVVEVLDR